MYIWYEKSICLLFFYLLREELKINFSNAFKSPLLHSINIIYIYTITFFNILNLIWVYLSEVFSHCLLKENIHMKTLGCYCWFTSWKMEMQTNFIQNTATKEQYLATVSIFKSLQNIFSEV